MVKYQLINSYSPESSLQVGFALGEIGSVAIVPQQIPGQVVEPNTFVRNIGDLPGEFYIQYIRWDSVIGGTFTPLVNTEPFILEAQAAAWVATIIDTMPNRDVVYRAVLWRTDGTADSTYDFTIEVLQAVPTTLTSFITPTVVAKGGTYSHSGLLTRNDSGLGVAGATVDLERQEAGLWKVIAQATTDASGKYTSAQLTAPTTANSYLVRAHYNGSAILNLAPSYSKVSTIGAGFIVEPWMVIAGAGAVAALLIVSGR